VTATDDELAAHFEARAAGYTRGARWVSDRAALAPILELLLRHPSGTAVEVGAGTGAVAQALASLPTATMRYIGVDIAWSMLREHTVWGPAVVGDAHRLPVGTDRVDALICRQAIHYFDRPEVALTEFSRVLREDGALLIAQIVPFDDPSDQIWWSFAVSIRQPLRRHGWTGAQLQSILRTAGFSIESTQWMRRRTSLKEWIDRYSLDSESRLRLIDHFETAPPAIRRLRAFVLNSGDIEYDLQWVFIVAQPNTDR
jgi:ubiquinone/menaquinone biosynthesis C-methylase UbiE